jgi:hypothetical protein
MRDQPTLPGNDPLQTTLDSLRSAIERTPLADSLSVRRRGEARSRHQAVAGALVVAALVAGAFGVADLRAQGRNSGIPAGPTPTASASGALLTADQMPDPQFWGQFGDWTKLGPGDRPLTAPANSCLDAAAPSGRAGGTVEFRAGPADGPNASLREKIYQFDSPAAATAAQTRVDGALMACASSHHSDQAQQSGVLDLIGVQGAQLFDRSYTGTADSRAVDLVAYGTNGSTLVVLGLVSPGIQDVAPTGGMPISLSLALFGAPPSETPGPLVTDVPARALMQKSDLTSKTDVGTASNQGNGVETLNACLLASDEAMGTGQRVFGPGGDWYASEFVITQDTEVHALAQLAAFAEDMTGCKQRLTSSQGATDPGTVTVTQVALTEEQRQALGPDAWAYQVEQKYGATSQAAATTIRNVAIGVRTRNAIALFSFSDKAFTADQAVASASVATGRLSGTYE